MTHNQTSPTQPGGTLVFSCTIRISLTGQARPLMKNHETKRDGEIIQELTCWWAVRYNLHPQSS